LGSFKDIAGIEELAFTVPLPLILTTASLITYFKAKRIAIAFLFQESPFVTIVALYAQEEYYFCVK
jgi:hypothetical protein